MLARSHNAVAPWTIVRADDKRSARLNVIKDVLSRLHYNDKKERLIRPDARLLFTFDAAHVGSSVLAP